MYALCDFGERMKLSLMIGFIECGVIVIAEQKALPRAAKGRE
jgi:hypothetical protein